MTLILVILSVLLVSRSRWLFAQYIKIENQFLNNLKGEETETPSANDTAKTE